MPVRGAAGRRQGGAMRARAASMGGEVPIFRTRRLAMRRNNDTGAATRDERVLAFSKSMFHLSGDPGGAKVTLRA